jgi:hypothetical protein
MKHALQTTTVLQFSVLRSTVVFHSTTSTTGAVHRITDEETTLVVWYKQKQGSESSRSNP